MDDADDTTCITTWSETNENEKNTVQQENSDDDNDNIYADISDFDLGKEFDKLKAENDMLKNYIQSLQEDIEKLTNAVLRMKSEQRIVEENISSLYLTAKAELERKDRTIAELQKKLDDLIFKRQQRSFVQNACQPNEGMQRSFPPKTEVEFTEKEGIGVCDDLAKKTQEEHDQQRGYTDAFYETAKLDGRSRFEHQRHSTLKPDFERCRGRERYGPMNRQMVQSREGINHGHFRNEYERQDGNGRWWNERHVCSDGDTNGRERYRYTNNDRFPYRPDNRERFMNEYESIPRSNDEPWWSEADRARYGHRRQDNRDRFGYEDREQHRLERSKSRDRSRYFGNYEDRREYIDDQSNAREKRARPEIDEEDRCRKRSRMERDPNDKIGYDDDPRHNRKRTKSEGPYRLTEDKPKRDMSEVGRFTERKKLKIVQKLEESLGISPKKDCSAGVIGPEFKNFHESGKQLVKRELLQDVYFDNKRSNSTSDETACEPTEIEVSLNELEKPSQVGKNTHVRSSDKIVILSDVTLSTISDRYVVEKDCPGNPKLTELYGPSSSSKVKDPQDHEASADKKILGHQRTYQVLKSIDGQQNNDIICQDDYSNKTKTEEEVAKDEQQIDIVQLGSTTNKNITDGKESKEYNKVKGPQKREISTDKNIVSKRTYQQSQSTDCRQKRDTKCSDDYSSKTKTGQEIAPDKQQIDKIQLGSTTSINVTEGKESRVHDSVKGLPERENSSGKNVDSIRSCQRSKSSDCDVKCNNDYSSKMKSELGIASDKQQSKEGLDDIQTGTSTSENVTKRKGLKQGAKITNLQAGEITTNKNIASNKRTLQRSKSIDCRKNCDIKLDDEMTTEQEVASNKQQIKERLDDIQTGTSTSENVTKRKEFKEDAKITNLQAGETTTNKNTVSNKRTLQRSKSIDCRKNRDIKLDDDGSFKMTTGQEAASDKQQIKVSIDNVPVGSSACQNMTKKKESKENAKKSNKIKNKNGHSIKDATLDKLKLHEKNNVEIDSNKDGKPDTSKTDDQQINTDEGSTVVKIDINTILYNNNEAKLKKPVQKMKLNTNEEVTTELNKHETKIHLGQEKTTNEEVSTVNREEHRITKRQSGSFGEQVLFRTQQVMNRRSEDVSLFINKESDSNIDIKVDPASRVTTKEIKLEAASRVTTKEIKLESASSESSKEMNVSNKFKKLMGTRDARLKNLRRINDDGDSSEQTGSRESSQERESKKSKRDQKKRSIKKTESERSGDRSRKRKNNDCNEKFKSEGYQTSTFTDNDTEDIIDIHLDAEEGIIFEEDSFDDTVDKSSGRKKKYSESTLKKHGKAAVKMRSTLQLEKVSKDEKQCEVNDTISNSSKSTGNKEKECKRETENKDKDDGINETSVSSISGSTQKKQVVSFLYDILNNKFPLPEKNTLWNKDNTAAESDNKVNSRSTTVPKKRHITSFLNDITAVAHLETKEDGQGKGDEIIKNNTDYLIHSDTSTAPTKDGGNQNQSEAIIPAIVHEDAVAPDVPEPNQKPELINLRKSPRISARVKEPVQSSIGDQRKKSVNLESNEEPEQKANKKKVEGADSLSSVEDSCSGASESNKRKDHTDSVQQAESKENNLPLDEKKMEMNKTDVMSSEGRKRPRGRPPKRVTANIKKTVTGKTSLDQGNDKGKQPDEAKSRISSECQVTSEEKLLTCNDVQQTSKQLSTLVTCVKLVDVNSCTSSAIKGVNTPNKQKIVTKKRITPTPVSDKKTSFADATAASKSIIIQQHLELDHNGEIPLLHIEEDHIDSLTNDLRNPDNSLMKLIDTMTLSNMESEIAKQDVPRLNVQEATSKTVSSNDLSFKNLMYKVSSSPVHCSNKSNSCEPGDTSKLATSLSSPVCTSSAKVGGNVQTTARPVNTSFGTVSTSTAVNVASGSAPANTSTGSTGSADHQPFRYVRIVRFHSSEEDDSDDDDDEEEDDDD